MDKQELQNEINKTKEHLKNLEKMLEECKYERWKPSQNETYYCISDKCAIWVCKHYNMRFIDSHFKAYNCFKTKEEAEEEVEKILVRRILENIARRLNKNKEIDWRNSSQAKYYIFYSFTTNDIESFTAWRYKAEGVVYCLDKNFKDIAIQEIGKERLSKYLKL